MPNNIARLDQYASLLSQEFNEVDGGETTIAITPFGQVFAPSFSENVGIGTTLVANVFSPYDPVYDEFAGVLYGPGQGTYMRHTSNKTVVVYNEIDEVASYGNLGISTVLGTKISGLGTTAISVADYPPAGWTSLQNATADTGNELIDLPFDFYLNNIAYQNIFVNADNYIIFGNESSTTSPTTTGPVLPRIYFGTTGLNYYQRVLFQKSFNNYVSIRYEGHSGSAGSPGNSNIILDITIFNPSLFAGQNIIEILSGNHSRTTSSRGVYGVSNTNTSTTLLTSSGMPIAQNQSHVLIGNSTGTTWNWVQGAYVSY